MFGAIALGGCSEKFDDGTSFVPDGSVGPGRDGSTNTSPADCDDGCPSAHVDVVATSGAAVGSSKHFTLRVSVGAPSMSVGKSAHYQLAIGPIGTIGPVNSGSR